MRRPILLFLTVSLITCGFLKMSDAGASLLSMSGQPVLDIHTEPQPGSGAGTVEDGLKQEGQHGKVQKYQYKYTTMPGYFLQADHDTKPAGFDFMANNFGLVDRKYDSDESLPDNGADMTTWQRFEHHITSLNRAVRDEDKRLRRRHGDDDDDEEETQTRYILFFLGRHGNGYHNIAERYYGSLAWDCHFSALDGDPDGVMIWSDAHLSKEGIRQARELNSFWTQQVAKQKMSLPQTWYVSPLDRAMETAQVTFEGLLKGEESQGDKLHAVVMERLREGTGIHTCDRRSDVSYIREHYPSYDATFDPLLTEHDEFWDPDHRETEDALTLRLNRLVDSIMQVDSHERVSITAHSGTIGALLRVMGHRKFPLGTGGVIPVFVKVERTTTLDDDDSSSNPHQTKRHGGSAEGKNHVEPVLNFPDPDAGEDDPNDRSKWPTIPSCPADMDLATVGFQRWNMTLDEFLRGVEDGSVQVD